MAAYGLTYPPQLLSSFPVVDPDKLEITRTSTPIRKLGPDTFSSLHLRHIVSHPPDGVLFPFLHGLEGDNEAQNMFFASQGQTVQLSGSRQDTSDDDTSTLGDSQPKKKRKQNTVPVPKYRGLMVVLCEDDLEHPSQLGLLGKPSNAGFAPSGTSLYSDDSDYDLDEDDDDGLEDDYEQDELDDSEGEGETNDTSSSEEPTSPEITNGLGVDMDVEVNIADTDNDTSTSSSIHKDDNVLEIVGIGADDKHMHPVSHRTLHHPVVTPIQTANLQHPSPNTADIANGSISTTSPSSIFTAGSDFFGSESPITPATSQTLSSHIKSSSKTRSSLSDAKTKSSRKTKRTIPALPLLTSTFRAKDLIRPVASPFEDGSGEWEFLPAKVPDGISLRNFGIQVPILASLSDIVIYSPTEVGGARSPNALRLAQRFTVAIERKRRERMERLGLESKAEADEELLDYNVFVLDATSEQINNDLSHLVMRVCEDGQVPGSLGPSGGMKGFVSTPQLSPTAASTMRGGDDGFEMDMEGDIMMSDSPDHDYLFSEPKEKPNTVDFAQRERDEMRDLTRASEIISIFPSPPSPATPSSSTTSSSPSPSSPIPSQVTSHAPLPRIPTDLSTTQVHFEPMIGQVFLGNSNDVPLPPDGEEYIDVGASVDINRDTGEPPGLMRASPSSSISEDSESGMADSRYSYVHISEAKTIPSRGGSSSGSGELLNAEEDTISTSQLPPLPATHPLNYASTNSPEKGHGYDICIECHDMAPFPTHAHLKAAEDKIVMLEGLWRKRWEAEVTLKMKANRRRGTQDTEGSKTEDVMPPRPPPHANSIIHLPFPSSPPSTTATMAALMPVLRFLERCLIPPPPAQTAPPSPPAEQGASPSNTNSSGSVNTTSSRRWSSVSSLIPSFPTFPMHTGPSSQPQQISSFPSSRNRSFTSPPLPYTSSATAAPPWSRPLKILLYSSDGYTESSVPALCLSMVMKNLSLPEAYLELQVVKRRSFFVYQTDLGLLRRVEAKISEERQERQREMDRERERISGRRSGTSAGFNPYAASWGDSHSRPHMASSSPYTSQTQQRHHGGRPSAKSVSFAQSPISSDSSTPPSGSILVSVPHLESSPMIVPSQSPRSTHASIPMSASVPGLNHAIPNGKARRPRANTSPWLPSLFGGDHQAWFNDPRFDGSFPSRVLPFLYLGNLAHASNVYMLHALGITHVVSVGECALVPPSNNHGHPPGPFSSSSYHYSTTQGAAHFVAGKGPGNHGSLWIEERAGRIKVLDIQGVCDDGIDTLEPQLEPICEWIDKARKEGGQVLVHCRVGVSRSATVTIAYVMKHLGLPLVDAYLIVRSRRLSVLIQPNMRLLYNLCGWEIKLAKERAGDDEDNLRNELANTLSWPYLAKEVHSLNEKYLH